LQQQEACADILVGIQEAAAPCGTLTRAKCRIEADCTLQEKHQLGGSKVAVFSITNPAEIDAWRIRNA
jgi:hypothetical protein